MATTRKQRAQIRKLERRKRRKQGKGFGPAAGVPVVRVARLPEPPVGNLQNLTVLELSTPEAKQAYRQSRRDAWMEREFWQDRVDAIAQARRKQEAEARRASQEQ